MLLIVNWSFQASFSEDKVLKFCKGKHLKHYDQIFPSALQTFITFSIFVSTTFYLLS